MGILVLGMHRSGTSAVTRLLNLMGCSLGPEQAIAAPAPDNPAGFWERPDVRRTNDRLLAALGRSWVDCLEIDLDDLVSSEVAEFEWSARKVLGDLGDLGASGPWALKDPRLCLVLEAWKPLVPDLVVVMVHRDPTASALSLRKRNGLRLPLGMALWEHYNLSALRAARGLAQGLIAYEDLAVEPEAASAELLSQLHQAGLPTLVAPDHEQLRAFIDPSLDHHGSEAAADHGLAPNEAIQRLSAGLSDGSALRSDVPPLSAESAEVLRTTSAQWPGQTWITRLLRERDAQVAQLQEQLKRAQGEQSRPSE